MSLILDPKKIEERSFQIIDGLISSSRLSGQKKEVIRRVIHATTDLDYAKGLIFHPQAIASGLEAIRGGSDIICDVSMVSSGINAKRLSGFGGKVICFINDKRVISKSSQLKLSRAVLAMRKAARLMNGAIIAIGNAPTALFEVCNLVKAGNMKPALIIGIPVGFVGAAESKKELRSLGIPYITNSGTKGGSSVAAAITNALLKMSREKE
ncbi:MAG: precorrin-8X methylmutase [Candidatus Omnitrophota bacterium]